MGGGRLPPVSHMTYGGRSAAAAAGVTLLALLVAAADARLTVASALSDQQPDLASKLAPRAPEPLASAIMMAVGQAAAEGRAPPDETMGKVRILAETSPLRPEPFLVQGALAARSGDHERAERLLKEARSRHPRGAAARYLLADLWLRQGQTVDALREVAILARLLPQATAPLVAALSGYARAPGARGELAKILRDKPELRDPVLETLSVDPANAELVMAIARSGGSSGSRSHLWQSRLLSGLVDRGDYGRAYRLWQQFAGIRPGPPPLIFNAAFHQVSAPPPFNWALSSSKAGLAEAANGKLRILYFGRQNTVLAAQLLLLPPGRYRFAAPVEGELAPNALAWSLRCMKGSGRLMEIRLGSAAPAAEFTVPGSGCPAQMLELTGLMQEMPKDSDVRIGAVKIERRGS